MRIVPDVLLRELYVAFFSALCQNDWDMVDFYDSDNISEEDKKKKEKAVRAAAVALTHEFGQGELPKIAAAGYGAIAEQIVRIAFDNGVKVRSDADLAQMLAAIELDSEIPSEALVAVAEILSYVYRENGTLPPMAGDATDHTGEEK